MEAFTSTPDFSSQWLPPPQSQSLGNEENLQQRLQTLLEGARESWTYAIFWLSSYDNSGAPLLGWGDGYYKGEDDKGKGKAPKTTSSPAEQAHRKRVLRELNSLITGASDTADEGDEEVTDTEWFFLVSMPQSFVNGSGLPGQAFFNSSPVWVAGPDRLSELACERAQQGQVYGLQTLVCIPCANGVVELASTEVILPNPDLMNKVLDFFNFHNPHAVLELASTTVPYNPEWIGEMTDFFYPLGTPRLPVHAPPAIKLLGKNKRLREREDTETQNYGNKILSMQSRGKEKISDSKCSWSLLSESSDGDTQSTFSHSDVYSGPSEIFMYNFHE